MTVVPFPNNRVNRSVQPASTPAIINAFPTARHVKIVAFIASEMRKKASTSASEEHLVDHLEIECNRLAHAGVADDKIERACRAFAVAAWAAALHHEDDVEGAAS